MKKIRNPVQGVRGHRPRSTCPAWGVSSLVTGRTGVDLLRRPWAKLTAANSSAMKGPRGLAGESCGRRCQAAKDLGRWVRGRFYVRLPEMTVSAAVNVTANADSRNYAGSGELDIRPTSLPCKRDSDVIRETEVMTNAGSSAAAGWFPVPGRWRLTPSSHPGDSNAVEWECGLSRELSHFKREFDSGSSDVPCKAVGTR